MRIKPLPLTAAQQLPAFPMDALPSWLGDYAGAISTQLGTPSDMAATVGLSCCSAALAGRFSVRVRPDWTEPCLGLYTLTVLPSGDKKSSVMERMKAPLVEWEQQQIRQYRPTIAATREERRIKEAQMERARKQAASDTDNAQEHAERAKQLAQQLSEQHAVHDPRLLTDDSTPEQLATLLSRHGRIAILSSEGTVFDLIAGRYSKSNAPNFDMYKRGYTCDRICIDRRGREEIIPRPVLVMGIAIQPSVLDKIKKIEGIRGEGLLARFLYTLPQSQVGSRTFRHPPTPAYIEPAYREGMGRLLDLGAWDPTRTCPEPMALSLSADATEIMIRACERVEEYLAPGQRLAAIADWANRYCGNAARIAAILHLAHHGAQGQTTPISSATTLRALKLMKYYREHALAAFDAMGEMRTLEGARRLADWIQSQKTDRFRQKDAHSAHRSHFQNAKEVSNSLYLLERNHWIAHIKEPRTSGAGRPPSPIYEINPAVFGLEV